MKPWEKAEDDIVRAAWGAPAVDRDVRPVEVAAASLPGRSIAAISTRAALLGVSKTRRRNRFAVAPVAPPPKKKRPPVSPGDLAHIRTRLLWTMEALSAELRVPLSRVADAITMLAEQRFHDGAVALEEMVSGIRLR